jgi:hypothetical protein
VEEDPGTSVRRISAAEGIGVPLPWIILHGQSLYPYRIQRVQALTPPDHRARVVYCYCLLAKCVVNPRFVAKILFTDEAGFTRDAIVNFHNTHVWVDDNLHTTVASRHQHRFSINVCVGIVGDQLLGPFVLPNKLTDEVYHRCLVNDLPVLLEHVPLHQRQHMWFMHDGVPPHFLRIVRQHLSQTFGEQRIGREGPVNWSARSPDLNPLDFWLWGHLRILVYSSPINDLEVLQQRLQNACQEIRVKPIIFDRVRTSVRQRAERYVEMHGNHIENLL